MAVFIKNQRTLVILALALSIIGTILVLSSSFGGMTVRTAYGFRDRYASLGSEYSEPLDNVFIILLAICMLATALLSFVALKSSQLNQRKPIRLAWLFSVLTLCLAISGGVAYDLVRADTNYEEWWLDTGFYAGLVVGLLNSISYSVLLRKRPSSSAVAGGQRTESSVKPGEPAKPAKDLDYIEKLRKLAEARDKGIITQEEFEKKKSQILRDSD